MKAKQKLAASVLAAILALSLTSCVKFIGPDEGQPAPAATEAPAETEAPETTVEGESTEPAADGEDSEDKSWGDKLSDAKDKANGGDQPAGTDDKAGEQGEGDSVSTTRIDLSPESGVQYLQAIQAFSPELDQWVLDRENGEAIYKKYNCLGQVKEVGTGILDVTTDEDGDEEFTVIWDGSSPYMIPSATLTFSLVTDRTLTVDRMNRASSRTDVELERYKGMCSSAGQALANFLL